MKAPTRVLLLLAAGLFLAGVSSISAQNSSKNLSPSEARIGWLKQIYGNREWKTTETPIVLILHDDTLFQQFSQLVPEFMYKGAPLGARTKVYNDPAIIEQISPHIVFFGENATASELSILDVLKPTGVVTVGEQANFIKRGGTFQLDVDADDGRDRIKLNAAGLAASKVSYRSRFLSSVRKYRP